MLSPAADGFDAGPRARRFAPSALARLFGPAAFAPATGSAVAVLPRRRFGPAASEAIGRGEIALSDGEARPAD